MLNQKGSTLLITAVVFLLILGSVAAIYYFKSLKQTSPAQIQIVPTKSMTPISVSPSPSVKPSATPIEKVFTSPAEVLNEIQFSKQNGSSNNKFFGDTDYPSELKNLPDNQLVGFKCTSFFYDDGKGNIHYSNGKSTGDPDNKYYKFTNESFVNFVKDQEKAIARPIESLAQCLSENNEKYVFFATQPTGQAGSGSLFYIGTTSDNYSAVKTIKLSDPKILGSTYSGCSTPIAITKSLMYLRCGGGDGGYGYSNLIKLNLATNDIFLMLSCTSRIDSDETGQSVEKVECR